jgi:hypothetical protein
VGGTGKGPSDSHNMDKFAPGILLTLFSHCFYASFSSFPPHRNFGNPFEFHVEPDIVGCPYQNHVQMLKSLM